MLLLKKERCFDFRKNEEANEHKRRLYEREWVQSHHNVPYDASWSMPENRSSLDAYVRTRTFTNVLPRVLPTAD